MKTSRRSFLAAAGGLGVAAALPACALLSGDRRGGPLFRISLAQWSLHRTLRAGELDNLEFAAHARERYGLKAVEYVNQFFFDKAEDAAYLDDMKRRADDAGVRSLLIMIDGEGWLAATDTGARETAIAKHEKWIAAAARLGCHSIRVNAGAEQGADPAEQQKHAADSLVRLADLGAQRGVAVIVENHGGHSSNGAWLAGVMRMADHPGVGTLPDFGNFHLGGGEWYDRYRGVEELMPFAKAVSAKSHEFDDAGDEVRTDYDRMLRIVLDAGYRGFVGIEYEGDGDSEEDGIRKTKALLERVRAELSAEVG
jgi:sugar phosphate isomerase/epimerase